MVTVKFLHTLKLNIKKTFFLILSIKSFLIKHNYIVEYIVGALPEALASGCAKCNEKQKQMAKKVIKFLLQRKPKDWERLATKYDPKGEYKRKYTSFVTGN